MYLFSTGPGILRNQGQASKTARLSVPFLRYHETEGVNPVTEAPAPCLEEKQEAVAIGICRKEPLSAIAALDDVIKTAGKVDARFASQKIRLANF